MLIADRAIAFDPFTACASFQSESRLPVAHTVQFALKTQPRVTGLPAPRPIAATTLPHRAGLPAFLRGRSLMPDASGEHEAESTAARLAAGAPATSPASAATGAQALAPRTRAYFETHLGADLRGVRLHTGPEAVEAAQAFDARAFTVGQDVVFNESEFSPGTREGRALLAHELTHVAQTGGAARGVRRKTLADAPAKQRSALSIPSSPVNIPPEKLKEYFEKVNGKWGAYKSAPSGVTVELSGIDPANLVPMTSIAMHLRDDMSYPSMITGETKAIFGPGMTVNVFLALAVHGLADGVFRFSWVGDAKTGTIYIESFAAGPKDENAPTESNGSISVGSLKFEHTGGWSTTQLAALTKALALIPEKGLAVVDGMKFKLDTGTSPDGEDGHYDDEKHTVVIFSSAFRTDDVRRSGDSSWPVHAIAHEIGHAIDRAPLVKAWKAYQGGGGEAKLKQAAAASGAKWKDVKGTWEVDERITAKDGEFRTAAVKDGVGVTTSKVTDANGATTDVTHLKGGATEYANTDWSELYADCFALYTTDPATLKLIRPNIHAYFLAKFPRKTP